MIKKYLFEYDGWYQIEFDVDTEVYTKDMALATLEFFTWSWNKEEDPILEVLKKIAIECLVFSIDGWNTLGVIDQFENLEGFPRLDGSYGVTLTKMDNFKFDENCLSVEIT